MEHHFFVPTIWAFFLNLEGLNLKNTVAPFVIVFDEDCSGLWGNASGRENVTILIFSKFVPGCS